MTAPRKSSPKPAASAATASAILSGLNSNLDDDSVPEEFKSAAAVEKTALEEVVAGEKDRVWIQLEDNEDIPPGGQFIGVNGRGYMLQAGVAAHVPRAIVGVLDNAIKSVAVKNQMDQIVRWRDQLRFPYRVLTNHRKES